MAASPEPPAWTVRLSGRGALSQLVGGKAAALDRLIALGAPVPAAGSVTTDAYRAFVSEPGLAALLERLRTEPVPPAGEHEAGRREVEAAFLAAPLAPEIEQSIRRLALEVSDGAALAVRSSATAEDMQSASFAGQYRSLLDVDPAEVTTAVRICWASLWAPVVRQYRRFRGIDERDVAMSALVMPMLRPEHAGVLFTQDPANAGHIRIEVVEGQGEGLVSGAKTPEVLTVGRAALDAFAPALSPLRELAGLALRLEAGFGAPLDVEWAIAGGRVFVLQARPITGAPAGDAAGDEFDVDRGDARYTTAGIAEMLPGVLPPREWEINAWMVEEALAGMFASLRADLAPLRDAHPLLSRFRGRAALNLDTMEAIVASIPGGSVEELEHQYFGEVLAPPEPEAPAPRGRAGLLHAARTLRGRLRAFEESEIIIQAVDRVLESGPVPVGPGDEALLAYRHRLLYLGARAMAAEIRVAATASSAYRSLEVFLRAHLAPEEALAALQRLTARDRQDLSGYRTLGAGALAVELRDDPGLADVRGMERWDEASAALAATSRGREFCARLVAALGRAGSTSVFAGPTWEETPELVWTSLRAPATVRAAPAESREHVAAAVERRIGGGFRQRLRRVRAGQLVDVRTHFLRREAADAAAFLERREHAKAALLMLGGAVRRVDLELGRRLVARGRLEAATDVDYLTGAEIRDQLLGRGLTLDVVARRRRQHWSELQEPPLPRLFRGRPGVPTPRPIAGEAMHGWAVSPGRYEGPARVVAFADGRGLRRGDVLVARTTDSSWLPLFHIAGAIVVEEGGPLSHAAILARELGMPAVVNLPGIVEQLSTKPGAVVLVDGSRGEVRIHVEPVPGDGPGLIPARPAPEPPRGDPGRLNVFITGLIGASALMSVVIGLTQAVGGVATRERISRRARPHARALAASVINGFDERASAGAGLPSRRALLSLGLAAAVAAVVALASTAGYLRSPSGGAAFVLALGATSAASLVAVAVLLLDSARKWPVVGPAARRLVRSLPHIAFAPADWIGAGHAAIAGSLLAGIAVLAALVAGAESWVVAVDRRVLDWLDAGGEFRHLRPDVLDAVFHREYVVPFAVLLTLAAYRCRAMMLTFPLVVAVGGALHLGLAHVIERTRPEIGPKPGGSSSFPGGFQNEQILMLGLLPLILYALTGSARLRLALQALAAVTIALTLADGLRRADHWPSDNLAGLMIGLAMVTIADGVARQPALHRRCRDCPVRRSRRVAR